MRGVRWLEPRPDNYQYPTNSSSKRAQRGSALFRGITEPYPPGLVAEEPADHHLKAGKIVEINSIFSWAKSSHNRALETFT